MRISKKAIRDKVEYLNGKQGYNITVFERQGLYSRLIVKKYDTELICKVLSNREIWDRLTVIDKEIHAHKETITIVIRDYLTNYYIYEFTVDSDLDYEVKNCHRLSPKRIDVDEKNNKITIFK